MAQVIYGGRKTREGTVVSDRMDKTAVVAVAGSVRHRFYKKIIRRMRRYMVHDETNDAKLGDRVRIVEARPYSRRKRWQLAEVLTRAERPEVAAGEIDLELLGEVKSEEEEAPPVIEGEETPLAEAPEEAPPAGEEEAEAGPEAEEVPEAQPEAEAPEPEPEAEVEEAQEVSESPSEAEAEAEGPPEEPKAEAAEPEEAPEAAEEPEAEAEAEPEPEPEPVAIDEAESQPEDEEKEESS